jgi:hypothetical protein
VRNPETESAEPSSERVCMFRRRVPIFQLAEVKGQHRELSDGTERDGFRPAIGGTFLLTAGHEFRIFGPGSFRFDANQELGCP